MEDDSEQDELEDSDAEIKTKTPENSVVDDNSLQLARYLAPSWNDEKQLYLLFVTSRGYIRRNLIEDFSQIRKNRQFFE